MSISIFCYFILLLHCNSEVNCVLLLHYIYLIPLVTLQIWINDVKYIYTCSLVFVNRVYLMHSFLLSSIPNADTIETSANTKNTIKFASIILSLPLRRVDHLWDRSIVNSWIYFSWCRVSTCWNAI